LAAPSALRAATAGERPEGIAADPGGHGGANTPGPADRAHAPSAPLSPEGRDLHDRFTAAIDDDLDTSTAVAIARETLRAPLPEDERRWLLLDFDYVLGLDLDRVWAAGTAADDMPAEVRELVAARAIARNGRDFERADTIRDELAALGWDVVDGPDGSQARPKVASR
jgi:cysteinyl-tRNA synthetase